MGAGLAHVTFHNKLGSQADRIARIAALAREIAPHVGADADLAEQAARVAKADLQSAMVGEFPELQGLMGRYYAQAAGLPAEVAAACQEHYSPLGPGDAVPSAPVSVTVALADKIDTLTGFWIVFEKPTGSKDPFALRRAALGLISLNMGNFRFNFLALLIAAWELHFTQMKIRRQVVILDDDSSNRSYYFDDFREGLQIVMPNSLGYVGSDFQNYWNRPLITKEALAASLLDFLHDRLKVHLRDEGIRHDVIDACLAMPGNDDLTLLVRRARALSDFLRTDDGENLLQGFKRANNILTQAEEKDGVEYSYGADVKFAETAEEKALFAALATAEPAIASALKAEDFAGAMGAMAALRAPIDAFFTAVQVNAESQVIRRNRLNLLSSIRHICLQAADLGRIEG
jgi:glycyl-tRNA synthetase beta chain